MSNSSEFITVNPSQLIALLIEHARAGESVGILGMPGQGKSEIVAQVAAKVGKPMLCPHNLALMDASDMKGIPTFLKSADGDEPMAMAWVQDKAWLQYQATPLTLFLDELPQATPLVMAAAAPIILEKRLDTLRFHADTWVVWAGNRASDRAGTNRIPNHIPNRSYLYELENTPEDWSIYELSQPVTDELTVRFVRMKGQEAFAYDPARLVNPTPRAWSAVARKLASMGSADDSALTPMIAGRIGSGLAVELLAFRRMAHALPSKAQILENPDTAPVPTEPSALFLVTDMLADAATVNNFDAVRRYAERLPVDFQAKLVASATKRDKQLFMTKAFSDWGVKLGRYI